MFACLPVCMVACLPLCMFACLSVCMFALVHVYMFACLPICMFHVCLFACMFTLLSMPGSNNNVPHKVRSEPGNQTPLRGICFGPGATKTLFAIIQETQQYIPRLLSLAPSEPATKISLTISSTHVASLSVGLWTLISECVASE